MITKSYSYKDFKNIQIPCRHAIAAIREFKYAVNDFIHEAYYITSYKATYQASFPPISMELSDDFDCGPCNLRSRRGRIPKKRKRRSQPTKRANTCSICKKTGHTRRSPLCSGYKPESFFYTRPAIGIKVRESTTLAAMPAPAIEPAAKPAPAIEPAAKPAAKPAIKPAAKPAIKPAAKPAAKPAIEPAQRHFTRKRKRDWRLPIKEDEEFETECDRINEACLAAYGRLPKTVDEVPYLAEFGLPGVIRHGKRRRN